jgi:hypothetical protein
MEKEIGGKTFDIRPLTRGEVKGLRKRGFSLGNLNMANAEEAMDEVLDLVCSNEIAAVDAMPNDKALDLFRAIIDLTYGRDGAEKNSETSGGGTMAADPSDVKAA